MRIISGTAKGIRLKMVSGDHVRPTADRVKESIFNVIGPFFEGGQALDLFAGAGGLGIEALSRGIERVVFVDKSPKSIRIVHENLQLSKLEHLSEVYCSDARVALRKLVQKGVSFQYIFLDPPYYEDLLIPVIEQISQGNILAEDGVIITEHPKGFCLPSSIGKFILDRNFRYGNSTVSLYHLNGVEVC